MVLEQPSKSHAARWLSLKVCEDLTPLVEAQAKQWKKQCEGELFASIYDIPIAEHDNFIRKWLGLEDDGELAEKLGTFPAKLASSHPLLTEYHAYWGQQLRYTQGACITQFDSHDANAEEIAEAAYQYFRDNPSQLTRDRLVRIRPYLPGNKRTELDAYVLVPEPKPLSPDTSIEEALLWATTEYLPYRRWQVQQPHSQHETAERLISSFVEWILAQYPRLTNLDRQNTPINLRVAQIIEKLMTEKRVLWVVVDGLSFINHHRLLELLAQTDAELRVQDELAAFAVLPTITEMAKWGLVTGQFPKDTSIRDEEAIILVASGLMKILYPDLNVDHVEFNNFCLQPAVEMRQHIRNQLWRLDAEYRQTEKWLSANVIS